MPYITREDGERFVIPSYRDVLTIKQKSQLKKEILLLSQSYGEYITLQKKNASQYEVAFSPDTGYLLGESIWHNFKKPLDMIYCEAIPNTTEAILVIVKSGSVYLDGSFPLDSIPEELIIFLTQQNNFEIYTFGDVPITQEPEAGKFSFEASSVKSFTILDKPVFPTLPLLKMYQLQLVDPVLKSQGIGVFPVKQLVTLAVVVGAIWGAYTLFTAKKAEVVAPVQQVNPYQAYNDLLKSAAPDEEISKLTDKIDVLLQIPGWGITDIKYLRNNITATVLSHGGTMANLFAWCSSHKAAAVIRKSGMIVTMFIDTKNRPVPKNIYPTSKVIAELVDRMAKVIPGNHLELGNFTKKGVYTTVQIKMGFQSISPSILDLIGKQLNGLPLVLHDVSLTVDQNGNLNGSLTFDALGS